MAQKSISHLSLETGAQIWGNRCIHSQCRRNFSQHRIPPHRAAPDPTLFPYLTYSKPFVGSFTALLCSPLRFIRMRTIKLSPTCTYHRLRKILNRFWKSVNYILAALCREFDIENFFPSTAELNGSVYKMVWKRMLGLRLFKKSEEKRWPFLSPTRWVFSQFEKDLPVD